MPFPCGSPNELRINTLVENFGVEISQTGNDLGIQIIAQPADPSEIVPAGGKMHWQNDGDG
jgi:hypothetical protein